MSDFRAVAWAIDGTLLATYATKIQVVGEGVSGVPPLRGSDRQYAFKGGAAHRARTPDSRSITLGFWVSGRGATYADRVSDFAARITAIRALIWKGGDQFTLSKTWTDPAGTHTASAEGIVVDGVPLQVKRSAHQAQCTIDVHLADPWFYGAGIPVTIPVGVPTMINHFGDDTTWRTVIAFVGQLSNPQLANSTPAPDVTVKLGTAVASGDSVLVDCDETTVTRDSDSANLIGALQHSGSRQWFGLAPGTNTVTLTADSGAGHAIVTYKPLYF